MNHKTPAPAPHTLPPRKVSDLSPEQALLQQQALAEKNARVRGVRSIEAMREAIRDASSKLPVLTTVPRVARLSTAAFRARAAAGLPFIMTGVVGKWPLCAFTPAMLRERFGDAAVRARTGDYVATAFAPDRAMQDMSLRDYLDRIADDTSDLPPYVGNLGVRELNALCHWPASFDKMGPPRFWIGPARTVTPLHCDYDDNVFAQIIGRKRIFLAPPHHDVFLYPKPASDLLVGSPFDPETPDFDRFPLARQAALVECLMAPGELLYVPAGWYHQVRALSFSLSANRWARGQPLLLCGPPAGKTPAKAG